jgi:hypothetical protein
VQQLNSLMEQKAKEVQGQLLAADKQIQKIDVSMNKSLEVAQIFQDKIPHGEIVERQNTLKYIKAAKLAHQGLSLDEIAAQVDLSRGELDFIVKVNRDQLQFSEEALPEWAKANSISQAQLDQSTADRPGESFIPTPERSLSDLGHKFRQALGADSISEVLPASNAAPAPGSVARPAAPGRSTAVPTSTGVAPTAPVASNASAPRTTTSGTSRGPDDGVRKVVFPRIDVNRSLE